MATNSLEDDLSDDDVMIAYHHGELCGMEGASMLACPYLHDRVRLQVWLKGYLDEPVSTIPTFPAIININPRAT